MIKEAADTVVKLKQILDEIHTGKLDVLHGQLRINNNYEVNGIDRTGTGEAKEAFVVAANHMICGGDVIDYHLKAQNEATKNADYEAAIQALREYRDALIPTRLRPDARIMGTADETEVDVPEF